MLNALVVNVIRQPFAAMVLNARIALRELPEDARHNAHGAPRSRHSIDITSSDAVQKKL
jgi:hypothetical protein